jgi:hypothetical protein
VSLPCSTCGGKRGHVEAICDVYRAEQMQRRDDLARRVTAYQDTQRRRLAALAGDTVAFIENGGYHLRLRFTSGMVLVAKLTGQEMDGHGENSPQRLGVTVTTAEEEAMR